MERLGCELYGYEVMKEIFALMKGKNMVKIAERKQDFCPRSLSDLAMEQMRRTVNKRCTGKWLINKLKFWT